MKKICFLVMSNMIKKAAAILLVFVLLATMSGCNSHKKLLSTISVPPKNESVSSKEESVSSGQEMVEDTILGESQTAYSDGWIYYSVPIECKYYHSSGVYSTIDSESMTKTGLFRVRPDGSERKQIVKNFVDQFIVSGNDVYYAAPTSLGNGQPSVERYDIFKLRIDGTGEQILCKNLDTAYNHPPELYLDNNQLRFTTYEGLYRINAKGKEEKILDNPGDQILFVEGGKLYYNRKIEWKEKDGKISYTIGHIYAKPVTGGKAVCLSELFGTDELYMHGDWIYFEGMIHNETGTDFYLCKVKKDGSGFTKIKISDDYYRLSIIEIVTTEKFVFYKTSERHYSEPPTDTTYGVYTTGTNLYRIGTDGKNKKLLISFSDEDKNFGLNTVSFSVYSNFTAFNRWLYGITTDNDLIKINMDNGQWKKVS